MSVVRNLFRPAGFAPAIAALCVASAGWAHDETTAVSVTQPNIEALSKTVLEGVENTEVIVSRVTLPANVTLPKHWHPGEEFGYVIAGQVTIHLDGRDDVTLDAGGSGHVPLKHVHTATSGPDGAVLLVFRVHEVGKPGRVLVE